MARSPQVLEQLVDEFLAVPPSRPSRKLKLGAELHQARRETADRLIDGTLKIISDWPQDQMVHYWVALHTQYERMKMALSVEDSEQMRVFAAKAIFRAEEDNEND